jgi:hypothetical protein
MNLTYEMKQVPQVEAILDQADIYGLRSEVRATAMALIRENPTLNTGSAYMMAAQEWDVL